MRYPPIRNAETLLEKVSARMMLLRPPREPTIVSIDGLGGAGKTSLAIALAEAHSGHIVSLDSYLVPHRGTYIPNLRYPELLQDLQKLLAEPSSNVIVEGLHVLAALRKVDVKPDVTTYIRKRR